MSGSSSGAGFGGGAGANGAAAGATGPCGACKFLRRKCVSGCVFAPYFDSEQGASHFAAVHKVFGASNASKLLLNIPAHRRLDAVVTICYEAQARIRDPVYGCVAHIFALQQQVVNLQAELSFLQAHLAALELPPPPPLQPPPALTSAPPPHFSIADLPSSSTLPPPVDLGALFDPLGNLPWSFQQQQLRQMEVRSPGNGGAARDLAEQSTSCGGGDLQALAREFIERPRSVSKQFLPPISK